MKKRKMLKVLPLSIIGALVLVLVTTMTIYGVTMEFIVHSSADFDIKGGGIQTTFSNNGYATVLKVGSEQGNVVSGNGTVAGVTCKTTGTLVNGGSYVKVNYQLINTNNTAVTVSLASHADTQVGSDDKATITTLSNNRGLSMSDGTNTFQLLLAKSYGVTDVDSFWFGKYNERTNNLWNQVTSTSLTNTDSGLVYAWQNRTIEANSEINLSVLFGVGQLNEPPTITLTSTLNSEYNSNESIPIAGNVNDKDSGDSLTIKYALDGGTEYTIPGTYVPNNVAKPYSTTISLPSGITQGQHTLQIWVTDSTGNMSEVIERTFTVNVAATVTSHYYYKDSTEKVANDEVYNGYVSQNYTTSAKTIDGYELVATPSNATGTITDAEMHVYYYYVQKVKVTTKYVDKLTGDLIEPATEEEYLDGQSYTTTAKTFGNYQLVTTPSNASGTAGRSNIEVVYEYKKKSAGVEIKYVDQSTGGTIADSDTITGLEGDSYTSTGKDINGYKLVVTPDNANGNMTVDKITVTYEYRLVSSVTTKYIDKLTGSLIEPETSENYVEGEDYTTNAKTFSNYGLVTTPDNANGTVGRENIEVIYEYKKKSAGVEIKYIDQATGATIADSETRTGLEGDPYTSSEKTIDRYELVKAPTNANGEMAVDKITVTYEYRLVSTVTTKYIDKLTGNLIEPETAENYVEGKNYTTVAKAFSGYELVTTPDNANGTVGRENIEVTYEYKKKSAGVEIKYIDQSTGEIISETITKTGLEGDPYTSSEKTIDEYELVVTPDNANGNMTVDKITVVYEYRLLCTVTAKYIDENYNTNIVSNVYQTLKEGQTYTTEEKNFVGYKLTDKTTNTNGTVGRTDIVVTYKYKKISEGVEIKYVDQYTGEEVYETDTLDGLEKDPYTTTPPEVDGYRLASTPSNASGQMSVTKITVTYPYKKVSNVTTKFINKITKEEIHDDVVNEYVQGAVYNTTPLEIDGYEVVVKPSNVTGVIGRSDIVVTYEYKKISEGVEIRFVDQANGNSISSSINLNGLEGAEYTSQAREIPGYELVVTPANANGNMAIDKITVTYEYRLNSYVFARYVDEYSGRTLKAEVKAKYKEGDPYTTSQEEIDGYTFSRVEGQVTGTIERTNIYVTYYYKKNTSVIVKYVDMLDNNSEIHEQITIPGVEGQDYNVEVLDIPGFTFIRSQGSRDGQMESEPITIILRYKKVSNLITQHIDIDTGEKICDDVIGTYKEGESYECSSQNVPGYIMVEEPAEKTGKIGREDIIKVYKYKKLSQGLVVRHVDKYSNEVLEEKTYEGNVGDTIEIGSKKFMYYIYDDGPHDEYIVLTPELTEVTYYYIKSIVMHVVGIDEATKEPLFDITRTGPERDYYKEEPKEIEGYEVVEVPSNAEGYYDRTNTKIEFVYRKIDAKPVSSINVKYVDKETNEVLDEVAITGEVGTYYRTERKSFENYELAEIVGSEAGDITEEEQNVTYYYTKKKGTVAVTYINENGNRILREEFEGKVGQDYNVTIKELDGYIITEYPTNTQGQYKDGTIEIIVKMKRDETQPVMSSVLAQYIDKDTGIALIEVLHTGENGEEYRTERKTIENYELLEVVGNEVGTITDEQQVVKYYYVRKDGLVNVIYEDQDGNVVKTESLVGKAGKRYKVIPENLVGYEIVELPDNMSGKYGETPIDVVIKVQKIQVAPAEKGTIIIDLVDKEGNVIGEKIIKSGDEGENISIELPDIDGYKLIGNKNITVTFEAGEKYFKAVYEKEGSTPIDPQPPVTETGRVIIKLVDRNGNEIGERIIKEGNKGDKVSVVLPDIDGYILTQDKNVEYTIVKGDKIVNAIYEKVVTPPVVETGKIIVNLVDKDGKVIGNQIVKEGKVGDKVKVELPEIDGYKITGNKTTEYVFEKGDKVINAVYEKDEEKPIDPPVVETGKIIVNLVDKDGKVIGSQIVKDGKVGEKVKIELPEIDGYKITGDKTIQYTIEASEKQVMAVYEKIVDPVNPEPENPEEPKQEEAPNTGDENIALLGIIALVSTLIIVKTKKELFNK